MPVCNISFICLLSIMEKSDILTALTVRIYNDEERQAIRTAMKETGCRQASRALIKMCMAFSRLADLVKSQSLELKKLQAENKKLRNCLMTISKAQAEADRIMQEREPETIERAI